MLKSSYKTWVFDCDGVILDSNHVKTDAFYEAAKEYGESAASALVKYHVQHGGISRYAKFEYFLTNIICRSEVDSAELEQLVDRYASLVARGLMDCEVADGLYELKELTGSSPWLIVSGGDQEELRRVFDARGLASLFDGGIFGSPDNKDQILEREQRSGLIVPPAVFVGDSQYDFEVAERAGLDFVFLSDWSESRFSFEQANVRLGCIRELAECIRQGFHGR